MKIGEISIGHSERAMDGRWPMLATALFLILALIWQTSIADENTGVRRVLTVGCHHLDGTCYVILDGPAFGASLGCAVSNSTEFRWDNADTTNGRRTYASMLTAFLTGKRVVVGVHGCSAQGYMSLAWYYLYD